MKRRSPPVALILSISIALALVATGDPMPIGDEFQVHAATAGNQDFQDLAMDGAGNFVVVWQSELAGAGMTTIRGRRFDSDARPLDGEFQISDYTTGQDSFPELAMTEQGDFVVVWASLGADGSDRGILGQRFTSDGAAVGESFQINGYTTGLQTEPAVALEADGDFVVVWYSEGPAGSPEDIRGRRFASDGTARGGEFQINSYTTGLQARPAVDSDLDGNFMVVWTDWDGLDGSFLSAQGRLFDSAGSARGEDFQINTFTTDFQSRPDVAATADGEFVVVWGNTATYTPRTVVGRRYASDGAPLGDQFQLNANTDTIVGRPAVGLDAGGNFVVSWSRNEPNIGPLGRVDVFARRFDREGEPRGDEFRVHAYTTGNQHFSAVAVGPDGRFVVTWHSGDSSRSQDGSGFGIQGRLYGVQSGLSVSLRDDRDPVLVDEPLTYTLQVADSGPFLATGIQVVDTLPAGVSFLSAAGDGWDCGEDSGIVTCMLPNLGLTSAPPIEIQVVVPPTAGQLVNSVTVSSDVVELGEDTAIETTEVLLTSDVFADGFESGDPTAWTS